MIKSNYLNIAIATIGTGQHHDYKLQGDDIHVKTYQSINWISQVRFLLDTLFLLEIVFLPLKECKQQWDWMNLKAGKLF